MTSTTTTGTTSDEGKDRHWFAVSYYNELAINEELKAMIQIQEDTIKALQNALEAYRRVMFPEAKRSVDRHAAAKT